MLRWLWEHRVTLVPVWVVLGAACTGLAARFWLTDLPTWQVAGLVALVLLPVLVWATRIARKWRRRWVLLLTGATGALITWMHAATPETAPLMLLAHTVLLVAILVGRLANAPLGEKVTMEGELRDWPEAGKRIGYPETRWVNTRLLSTGGWTARLVWPRGQYDRDQVRRDVHKFEGARDLPAGSLRLMPVGRARNTLDAIYIPDAPGGRKIPWPGVTHSSVTEPVALGVRDDGTPVAITRFRAGKGERRILVGGASESGKSGVINNLVGEDACRDDVVGLGMDLKGGVELGPWAKVLLWMVHNIDGAIEMLAALEAAAAYRLDYMREHGHRVWPVSPALPAIHLTIDEIRKLAGSTSGRTGKQQRLLLDRLVDVATQGRAVGLGFVAAGQRLTLEALGTSQISSQFDIRIGLRMNERDSASYVFPDDNVRLHEIPSERPGMAYLKDGDRLDPMTHQGYFWSDELVAEVAELRAGGGAMLDQGTGDAMAAASPLFAEVWAKVRGGDGDATPDWFPADLDGDTGDRSGDHGGDSTGDAGESAGGDSGVSIETALLLMGAQTGNGEELVAAHRAGTLPEELLDIACDLTGRPRPPRAPETFRVGDVLMSDVVARNRERTLPEGAVAPTPLPVRPRPKLSDTQARATMRQALAQAGATGCSAKDLYTAAGRSSSWFHPVINEWIDDEGTVVRGGHGRYVAAQFASELARTGADG